MKTISYLMCFVALSATAMADDTNRDAKEAATIAALKAKLFANASDRTREATRWFVGSTASKQCMVSVTTSKDELQVSTYLKGDGNYGGTGIYMSSTDPSRKDIEFANTDNNPNIIDIQYNNWSDWDYDKKVKQHKLYSVSYASFLSKDPKDYINNLISVKMGDNVVEKISDSNSASCMGLKKVILMTPAMEDQLGQIVYEAYAQGYAKEEGGVKGFKEGDAYGSTSCYLESVNMLSCTVNMTTSYADDYLHFNYSIKKGKLIKQVGETSFEPGC